MKRFAFVLTTVLLVLQGTALAGDKLRIATEGAYPPFSYVDDKGRLAGFDVDVSLALCKAMRRECSLVAVPWERIIDGLRAGEYDAVVAQMAKTPEREKVIDFTERYCSARPSFVARAKRFKGNSPADLAGKTVATQKDTYLAGWLSAAYGKDSRVVLPATAPEILDLLVKGEVDAAVSDSLFIYSFLQSERGRDFDFLGDPLPADDPSASAYIAVRKGDDKLRDALNKAFKAIRMDGTYDRISRKYFPYSTY